MDSSKAFVTMINTTRRMLDILKSKHKPDLFQKQYEERAFYEGQLIRVKKELKRYRFWQISLKRRDREYIKQLEKKIATDFEELRIIDRGW